MVRVDFRKSACQSDISHFCPLPNGTGIQLAVNVNLNPAGP